MKKKGSSGLGKCVKLFKNKKIKTQSQDKNEFHMLRWIESIKKIVVWKEFDGKII